MDLKHLRSFVAVAEHLNFSKAAETLNITQPALSVQIKELEEFLGTVLVSRGRGQRVAITRSGEAFLQDAQKLLTSAQRCFDGANLGINPRQRLLEIGLTDDFYGTALPDILHDYHGANPDIRLNYHINLSSLLVEQLVADQLDLAVLCFPMPIPGQDLAVIELGRMPIVLAVHEQHRLSQTDTVSLDALRDDEFILIPPSYQSGFSLQQARLFAHANFTPRVAAYIDATDWSLELIRRGQGVGILSSGSIKRCPDEVRILALSEQDAYIETAIVYRKDSELGSSLAMQLQARYAH